jgi:shikimate kinase
MIGKIVLVGYMAAGKTQVARKMSEKLNIKAFDLDDLIEKKLEMSVSDVFKTKGALYFRKIEHQIFKELMMSDASFILSTGGGTPCYANNDLFLNKEFGISFYLKASVQTLENRLQNQTQNRPLLEHNAGIELNEFIAKHLFDRSFFYYKAQHIIQTDDKSIEDVADEILSKLP